MAKAENLSGNRSSSHQVVSATEEEVFKESLPINVDLFF